VEVEDLRPAHQVQLVLEEVQLVLQAQQQCSVEWLISGISATRKGFGKY
jgi:hypothetical protein